jgi:hypothetical protein
MENTLLNIAVHMDDKIYLHPFPFPLSYTWMEDITSSVFLFPNTAHGKQGAEH